MLRRKKDKHHKGEEKKEEMKREEKGEELIDKTPAQEDTPTETIQTETVQTETIQTETVQTETKAEEPIEEVREPIDITISDIELERLRTNLNEYESKHLRALAESENARKRLQRERQELTKFAVENVLGEFLKPLDSFEQALGFAEQGSDDVKNWAIGFKMILTQFKDILDLHGVQSFDSEGKSFDPHLHEAVETEETAEHPENTIIKVFAVGYKMGDRIIRPARVKVAKAIKKTASSTEE